MGIVWEAYHNGVPLLGVPENAIENLHRDKAVSKGTPGFSNFQQNLAAPMSYLWTRDSQSSKVPTKDHRNFPLMNQVLQLLDSIFS